jgi:hypothetical protein
MANLLIGAKNFATQEVVTNGLIEFGNVYRRFCKRINGTRTFEFDNSDIVLQQNGIYHITVTAVASGTEAGVLAIQLYENGNAISGAFSNETITTPDTELRTLTLDYYTLVDNTCVLGCNSTVAKAISIVNTGIPATFTSVVINIEKVA